MPDEHARPVEELVLRLTDPRIETAEGKRRVTATAKLDYAPATSGARRMESPRYIFTAPLGPIEKDDLRWYLERYFVWPVGVFKDRAEGIERKLPDWGQDLFRAALGAEEAREAFFAWQHTSETAERRFSVLVDDDSPLRAEAAAGTATSEAAAELLALPWELLHDGRTWLFQGGRAVRVRRRLPNRHPQPARPTALPIRILLVSPRPENDGKGNRLGYIDHRITARPLTEAVESLGDLARLTILQPPTYGALEKALQAATDHGEPFDVIHFDGHGVYDRRLGLGALCFEDPGDAEKLEDRRMHLVYADQLAGLVRQHRIPLVFLEACQTAMVEEDPTASVAAKLLEEGVASVVAMSHSVLVETARRFVGAFYAELSGGALVGRAMLAGQRALFADSSRGKILGAGELRLQDWFVPVLYQEEQDPRIINRGGQQPTGTKNRRLSLGDLPAPPPHHFQGRSRELLALERLLHREPWAVVRGTGGQGKTTLAAELARWLVRTERFERAAFVSLEKNLHAHAVLDTLGHQLVGLHYSVAQFRDLDEALQPIERALADQPTIVVLDNCESVLPERVEPATAPSSEDASSAIFALCQRLLAANSRTRLVFTTREPLPEPFDHRGRERELGALDRNDAIELVSEVMKQNGWTPPVDDAGGTPQEIIDLVEAVNRHARALVRLAPEVACLGVKVTTEGLRELMADLERKHPGDRENSLYASVELSLRRLAKESREHVRVLAVCQGGVQLDVLTMFSGLEPDAASQLAVELIEVGLGEDMGSGHLRLDPGLPPYLLGDLAADDAEGLRSRWAEAMAGLTGYLYREQGKDARLASQLTLLELPNLLAMLDWLQTRWPPERVVELAQRVEGLVANLGRPHGLARATQIREQAGQKLDGWSHARFVTEGAQIDRLLERGDLHAAHAAGQQLLAKCLAVGETAFPEAAYDAAHAHFIFGRMLKMGSAAEAALAPLAEARRRFQKLADAGDPNAERMAAVTFTETGDCLRSLGRLEEAAEAYEEQIRRALGLGDHRGAAVAKFQLGTARLYQKRYREGLGIYTEARDTFEALGEPGGVAMAWHQIGMVQQEAGQFEPAEEAYRQSLAISVRENDLATQASTLDQLGLLYGSVRRFEESVVLHEQAAQIRAQLGDLANEGRSRSNLAVALAALQRYDEARQELQRAIECKKPYGHAAEPWKTWSNLEDLERTTSHVEAAQAARRQAIGTYLAYRRAGGVSQSPVGQLYALVAQAIQENTEDKARQSLAELAAKPDIPSPFRDLIERLQAVFAGDHDLALPAVPELDYANAAELQLLLEALGPEGESV